MRVLALALLGALAAACHSSSQPSPRSSAEAAPPQSPTVTSAALGPTQIDAALRAAWAKEGVSPVAPATDARFLRRVYVDIVGTIPPPEVVVSFASDPSPDKRAKLVDSLLASPAYAEHWATYWSDTLIGHGPDGVIDKATFQKWMVGRFAANVPWNQIVTELVAAQGQNGEGGPRGWLGMASASAAAPLPAPGAPMQSAPPAEEPAESAGGSISPPVNWFIRYREAPQDLAGNASRIFLGVQIQCAQCHDHKTEKWKQEDFKSFAACFMRTRAEVLDKGKMAMGDVKRVNVVDIGRPLPRYKNNPELQPFAAAPPKALDGTDLAASGNARQALAAWMTSPSNPWFAQAIVNRMWAHFLGRGFFDPIDDYRPSNPVGAPDVLAMLSRDFAAEGYDLKHLIRVITGTEAYGLSSAVRPAASSGDTVKPGDPNKLWSRFRLEPLGPEELLNALMDATGVEDTLRRTRANVERIRYVLFEAYSYLFNVDEEFDQTDFEGTVSQALAMLNGGLVGGGTSGLPGGALDKILTSPDADGDKVTALYLRTLSRSPSPEELAYFVKYVRDARPDAAEPAPTSTAARPPPSSAQAPGPKGQRKKGPGPGEPGPLAALAERDAKNTNPRRRAFEDVFWALLNSSEFTFNH
jgi:hypothetical protein